MKSCGRKNPAAAFQLRELLDFFESSDEFCSFKNLSVYFMAFLYLLICFTTK